LSDSRHDESNNHSAADSREPGIDRVAIRADARGATNLRVVFRTKSPRGPLDVGIATATARVTRRFSHGIWALAQLAR